MTKSEISQILDEKHVQLFEFLHAHPLEKWNVGPEGKWTTGQHIVHLIQSSKALNKGLKMPKLLLWYKFGKANRALRSYEEVVQRYKDRLSELDNPISPLSRNMSPTPPETKPVLIEKLKREKEILKRKMNQLSDKQMDQYLLPHPAMGRMILREIIMWTAYHTEHHHNVLKEKY